MGGFLSGKTLNANQIEFINMIVDYLANFGVIDASILYESPFTDSMPRGPEEISGSSQVEELMKAIESVRATAMAA